MSYIDDFRAMTNDQLQEQLLKLRKEQFNLRMQQAVGQSPKPHLHKQVRRNIARLKMLMGEKKVQSK